VAYPAGTAAAPGDMAVVYRQLLQATSRCCSWVVNVVRYAPKHPQTCQCKNFTCKSDALMVCGVGCMVDAVVVATRRGTPL
jgi:hypothetical protein